MGQQHSLAGGRGMVGIPNLATSTTDGNPDNSHSHFFSSASQNTGCQDQGGSANPSTAVNGTGGETGVGGVEQAQSVRAAIDSFIETCLAGSDEGPPSPRLVLQGRRSPLRSAPAHVEVITVPDEDDSDDVSVNGAMDKDNHAVGCASSEGKDGISASEGTQLKEAGDVSDKVAAGAPEKGTDSAPISSDVGASLDNKQKKDTSPPSVTVTVPSKDPVSDTEAVSDPSAKPSPTVGAVKEKASNSGNNSREGSLTSHIIEGGSHGMEGMESMRLKTIIDRMLDNSLGGCTELSPISSEQRSFPQMVGEENSNNSAGTQLGEKSTHCESNLTGGGSGARTANHRDDRIGICFMEHIEKAVERSFSSITEEEERKEQEKVVSVPVSSGKVSSESKTSTWSGHSSKPSDSGSSVSGADRTISVQDIVDRVISQADVVGKQPMSSLHHSSDSKPTVSASGTFYPDKVTADTGRHNSPQHSQRKESHKEDMTPRDIPVGRRGRPRMRSPCPERREPVQGLEYIHGSRDIRRGVVPGEDYLQSMQAALVKYSTVPPPHRMPQYLPAAIGKVPLPASTAAAVAAQNSYMMGGLHHHASPGSLQPRLHSSMASQQPALHGLPSMPSSQPPPLLRVDVMDRGDISGHAHAQPKPLPPTSHHPPSRSCMCQACSVYWTRERDAERARIVQQQQQQHHHHQQASPVDRSMGRMPVHPSYSKPMPASPHSHKWPMEGRHLDAKQEKPHSHYPYQRGHEVYQGTLYNVQTGLPVPHLTDADKPSPDMMVEYAHRQAKSEVIAREMGQGRHHPYPTNISSGKLTVQPSHTHALPHDAHHRSPHAAVTTAKPEAPLLDLTCRREDTTVMSASLQGEEDKPLDLSAKKPSLLSYAHERHDARLHPHQHCHRRDSEYRYEEVDHSVHAGLLMEQERDGEMYVSTNQHLHNLETSVETHFQKLQHAGRHGRGVPLHGLSISASTQNYGGLPLHSHGVVPHQTISIGRPTSQSSGGQGSSLPLQPHNHTLPPSHTVGGGGHPGYAAGLQPVPAAYPQEPLLSPGGRRPQLHPIPAPNPSTTLGSAPARSAPTFQSRTSAVPGGSSIPAAGTSAGVPAVMSALPPGSSTSPMVPLPSSMLGATPPAAPMPASSPQRSGSGGGLQQFDYPQQRLSGSRSVSPPAGSGGEGRVEDRQRGNSVSKHEPIHSILGNNNPQDILYLICRLCRQTYGSPYGFRKHFRNQHGFEPKQEHALVQTISATKNARQISGRRTPILDPESPSQDGQTTPRSMHMETGSYHTSHPSSPRPDFVRSVVASSPGSGSCESMGEAHYDESMEHRRRNSFSRTSTDSKRGSPHSGSGSVGVDDREDTKCLECQECGQTFQLNDFGSYKRHCRQHGQMKGVGREGGSATQGVYSCTECPCSYPDPQLLQDHMKRHHANTTNTFTCPLCCSHFACLADLQDHTRTVHHSSHETASSSSSQPGDSTTKVSSASSSHCDISSSSSAVKRETPSTSVSNSLSSFNLTVTTPSDLEICRLPADPIVTSASPDSSSDNKKTQDNSADGKKAQDSSPVSSSEQVKTEVKTESCSVDSPKSPSLDGTELANASTEGKDSVRVEMDNKQFPFEGNSSKFGSSASIGGSSNSSLDMDENIDLFVYKHKKFSAHRKRSASSVSEHSASDTKQACLDDVNTTKSEEVPKPLMNSSGAQKQQAKMGVDSNTKSKTEETKAKATSSKTEARHPLPFVWDRVTRSQAGKNSRSSDYS